MVSNDKEVVGKNANLHFIFLKTCCFERMPAKVQAFSPRIFEEGPFWKNFLYFGRHFIVLTGRGRKRM